MAATCWHSLPSVSVWISIKTKVQLCKISLKEVRSTKPLLCQTNCPVCRVWCFPTLCDEAADRCYRSVSVLDHKCHCGQIKSNCSDSLQKHWQLLTAAHMLIVTEIFSIVLARDVDNHRVHCLQREAHLISQKLQSALTFGPSAPTSPTRPGGPGSP